MNPEDRFSRISLVTFAGLSGFIAGALLLVLGSTLVGALPLSFGNALVRLPILMGGDLTFLLVWFVLWIAIGILVGLRITCRRARAPSPALLSKIAKLHGKKSFTLIELLIVVAVIAVLATVVIMVLNPAQMLMQARDANRLSDMKTLNQALQLYSEDVGTGMGSSSVVYVSVPDPLATTSAGSDCAGIGLASSSLPTGWTYHCAGPNYYKNVDGTGWIPVDFKDTSFGSPIGILPVDPVNTTSSGLYYTYTVQGDPWELTANMESSKYQMGGSDDVESKDGGQYPDLYEVGSDLSLMPIDYNPSLVGYWKLDEGSGTVAYDSSGYGNNGTWSGTEAGTSGYYSAGYGQTYAGYFDGSTDYVNMGAPMDLSFPNNIFTATFWEKITSVSTSTYPGPLGKGGNPWEYGIFDMSASQTYVFDTWVSSGCCNPYNTPSATYDLGTWEFFAWTNDGSHSRIYRNGVQVAISNYKSGAMSVTTSPFRLGKGYGNSGSMNGYLEDVRIYNRALSASEIQVIYNSKE